MSGRHGGDRAITNLALWVLLAVGAALAIGVGRAGGQEQQPQPDVIGEAGNGALLYSQACATCHGVGGGGGVVTGTDRAAPPIDGDAVSFAYWDLVIRTGRMPPPESDPFDNRHRDVVFTDQERADLNAFAVEELGVDGDLPPAGVGDPGRGLELWAANCAQCHGALGQGGVAGAGTWTPTVTGYGPQTIASAIRVGPFEMPEFDQGQIGDAGLADISAFLHDVEEEEGTLLGFVELNPVFSSGFVAVMAVVVVLSLMWISGKPAWFPDTASTSDSHPDHEDDDRRDAEADQRDGRIARQRDAADDPGEEQQP